MTKSKNMSSSEHSNNTLDRIVKFAVISGIIAGLIWLLGYLSDVLIPFIIAFLFAYLLHPIVCFVQKKIPSRALAIFVVLFGVIILMVGSSFLIIPKINHEISHTGKLLKRFVEDKEFIARATKFIPPNLVESIKAKVSKDNFIDLMQQEKFWVIVQSGLRKIAPRALDLLSGTANFFLGILGLFIICLYLVFLLLDYEKVKKEWKSLVPEKLRAPIFEFIDEFDRSMNRYFRAQAMVACCTGIVFAIGFTIIGLPMGIFLGLFLGLLNMVPYLQIVGIVPATLLAFMKSLETGTSFWQLIGLILVVFVVAQIIQDVILTPKIMGELTGLSPAMILLSISIWGKLLGFLGLVIAIPMTCLSLAYYHRILSSQNETIGKLRTVHK